MRFEAKKIFRDARRNAGITQATAAEVCGVVVQTVGRWESGASALPAQALLDLQRHVRACAEDAALYVDEDEVPEGIDSLERMTGPRYR